MNLCWPRRFPCSTKQNWPSGDPELWPSETTSTSTTSCCTLSTSDFCWTNVLPSICRIRVGHLCFASWLDFWWGWIPSIVQSVLWLLANPIWMSHSTSCSTSAPPFPRSTSTRFASLWWGWPMDRSRLSMTQVIELVLVKAAGLAAPFFRSMARLAKSYACSQTCLPRMRNLRSSVSRRRSIRVAFQSDISPWNRSYSSKLPNRKNFDLSSKTKCGSLTVWETLTSDPARTMTARMLLKWSKHEDGTPRAKARLIVRGYSDVDALQGALETSSPTTTRLSRNMLLSLSTILPWNLSMASWMPLVAGI